MDRLIIYLAFIIIAFIPGIMKQVQKSQNQQTSGASPQKPEASAVCFLQALFAESCKIKI